MHLKVLEHACSFVQIPLQFDNLYVTEAIGQKIHYWKFQAEVWIHLII